MTVFCRDCKHCIPDKTGSRYATCVLFPREPEAEYLVTGNPDTPAHKFCVVLRGSTVPGNCGPAGQLYQALIPVEA